MRHAAKWGVKLPSRDITERSECAGSGGITGGDILAESNSWQTSGNGFAVKSNLNRRNFSRRYDRYDTLTPTSPPHPRPSSHRKGMEGVTVGFLGTNGYSTTYAAISPYPAEPTEYARRNFRRISHFGRGRGLLGFYANPDSRYVESRR